MIVYEQRALCVVAIGETRHEISSAAFYSTVARLPMVGDLVHVLMKGGTDPIAMKLKE